MNTRTFYLCKQHQRHAYWFRRGTNYEHFGGEQIILFCAPHKRLKTADSDIKNQLCHTWQHTFQGVDPSNTRDTWRTAKSLINGTKGVTVLELNDRCAVTTDREVSLLVDTLQDFLRQIQMHVVIFLKLPTIPSEIFWMNPRCCQ